MELSVTCKEASTIDKISQEQYKIPPEVLMERASLLCLPFLERLCNENLSQKIVFLCGKGNNGGDGLALARLAYEKGYKNIVIALIGRNKDLSPLCTLQLAIINAMALKVEEDINTINSQLTEETIVVDGLYGTGFKGVLTDENIVLVASANRTKGILSIDIPSGMSQDSPYDALKINSTITVTFGYKKSCFLSPNNRKNCGEIVVVNPGFPKAVLENSHVDVNILEISDFPKTTPSSFTYKNKKGHVAIFGGSPRYSGAPRLCAKGAFNSGCGLVSIVCDRDIFNVVATESPSVIVNALDLWLSEKDKNPQYNAMALGPGWGEGREDLFKILMTFNCPKVIDASALDLIAKFGNTSENKVIITPHTGEFIRMGFSLGSSFEDFINGPKGLKAAAKQLNAIVVLKSSVTFITDGQMVYAFEGLNGYIGVAGSGDVLCGIIASFLAQGMGVLEAAIKGVILHQKAGSSFGQRYFDAEELAYKVSES